MTLAASAIVAAATLALAAAPGDELARGRNAFFRAEYARAIQILHPLVYPELRLESEEEVVQAHRMLGVAYLFEQKPVEARREFRKLLELRPEYRFDPLLDPPRVVDFFNEVLREQASDLSQIEARRRQHDAAQAARRPAGTPPAGAVLERRYQRRSLAVAFVPFGAGQFQNGQRRKGWAFLAGESALAALSLSAFATNFALFGVRPQRGCTVVLPPRPDGSPVMCPPENIDHSDEELSHNLTRLQVTSGALFLAAAIWGIIDAVHGFQPEVLVDETAAPPPPAAPSARLHLFPLVAPSAGGVALSLAF